ncbi:MAG: peptide-methionine (S)-S-oxide reductase MsrA [Gammaproteobacteria bacterium]|nr:peptide-methionine (S)-S-oxide reductase MsrA [Gammaproteobacteria bacterium]
MKNINMPTADMALPGSDHEVTISDKHFVNGHSIKNHIPEHMQKALFGLGCFWGAERLFWLEERVYATAVGYTGGFTPNPSYQEVCTGLTGHNEVVLVIYDPNQMSYQYLLKIFWEAHNPTQGMRQGNDVGTQYRSGIYTYTDEQLSQARASEKQYQQALTEKGIGKITTEIMPATEFYYAEDYHQQYLAKNPQGYCGLVGTGASLGSQQ